MQVLKGQRFVAESRYVTEPVVIEGVTAKVPSGRRDDFMLATFIAGGVD